MPPAAAVTLSEASKWQGKRECQRTTQPQIPAFHFKRRRKSAIDWQKAHYFLRQGL